MNYVLDALKKYGAIKGRARRSEYWFFLLFYVAVSFVFGFVSSLIGISIIGTILTLLFLPPMIAVSARRMQDVGMPWYYMFIPVYSLILAIREGEKGSNQYGADPKTL